MKCKRCGSDTPRLTLTQRYCPACDREVAATVRIDRERMARRSRFSIGKDLSGSGLPL